MPRKLTIFVGLGAFPVTIMGDPSYPEITVAEGRLGSGHGRLRPKCCSADGGWRGGGGAVVLRQGEIPH